MSLTKIIYPQEVHTCDGKCGREVTFDRSDMKSHQMTKSRWLFVDGSCDGVSFSLGFCPECTVALTRKFPPFYTALNPPMPKTVSGISITQPIGNCNGDKKTKFESTELLDEPCPGCRACC